MTAEPTMEIVPTSPARKSKRGFTLTEIAIVLGIVGLILGAIWVAAAAVYQNMRVAKANTEILSTLQAVRAMYATSNVADPGADMPLGFGPVAAGGNAYVAGGVFPTDTLDKGNPATSTIVSDPWQGGIMIRGVTGVILDDSVELAMDKVPQSACIALMTSISGVGKDPGLYDVGAGAAGAFPAVGTVAAPKHPSPIVASTASAACPVGNDAIGFAFQLK